MTWFLRSSLFVLHLFNMTIFFRQDCLMMINSNQADMLTLDSGMGYMAGEFFTMMPIMAERYSSGEY